MADLTEWEKRNEYYSIITLRNDSKKRNELLEQGTREYITARAASTNAIITSQENILEALQNIYYAVENGMAGLKASFEFGISEVVWQIEQNRESLKNILQVLIAPLDIQAKELRNRALEAYANGWFEDALQDFLQSEKINKYDFTVHINIGMIYLFHLINREKALEYFEKAVKYAKPKSYYYASFALLHAALIKHDFNQIADAEKLTEEAIQLSPNFEEALYQNAQYNAILHNIQKSLYNLEKAVHLDRNYCIKADHDDVFNTMREDVNQLFLRLKNETQQLCINTYKSIELTINMINQNIKLANNDINTITSKNQIQNNFPPFPLKTFSNDILLINNLIKRNSYFDSLDAYKIEILLIDNIKTYISMSHSYLNDFQAHFDSYCKDAINNIYLHLSFTIKTYKNETQEKRDVITSKKSGCLLWFLLIIISYIIEYIFLINNSILAIITVLIGWFIAKALLKKIALLIYPDNNFSQLISSKDMAKEKITKVLDEINVILDKTKHNILDLITNIQT